MNKPKIDNIEVFRKTKTETTYEYKPILGEVLGYWRKTEQLKVGETIEIHLTHSIADYDRIVVNGKDITKAVRETTNYCERCPNSPHPNDSPCDIHKK